MSLTGADILLRSLHAQGVRAVFGMPGTQNVALYDAFHRSGEGLAHYLVRHEQGATMLANGFARASGEVAAAFTVPGPGAANGATGILDALTDCVPILLVVNLLAPATRNEKYGFPFCRDCALPRPRYCANSSR